MSMRDEKETAWPNGFDPVAAAEGIEPDDVYEDLPVFGPPDEKGVRRVIPGEKRLYFNTGDAMRVLLLDETMFYNQKWLVNCNDVFAWGCADAEEIDIDKELEAMYGFWLQHRGWGPAVWCLIKRRELPQEPVAKSMAKAGFDLEALAKEHDLRPNFYDGVSKVSSDIKYGLYLAWCIKEKREAVEKDPKWWEDFEVYKAANPDWYKEQFSPVFEEARAEWIRTNGHSEDMEKEDA